MKVFVFFMGYLGIMCASCHSFLSDYPKDQVYPTGIDDFNELLVGDGYSSNRSKELGLWFQLMDDDSFLEVRNVYLEIANCHYWDISDADREACWLKFYKHIEVANVVLDGLKEFESSEELYRRVRGEAYFLRGAYYYFLVNLYAEPYSPKTASTVPGVPLKLDPMVNNRHYSRNSVEDVYRSVVSDLTQAVACLKGIDRQSPYRANEMAARLLLSRVFLYMERWENVLCHCDTILESSFNQLLDYNNLSADANVISGYSVETLFSSGNNSYGSIYWGGGSKDVSYFRVSDELLGLYDESDLRLVYFYQGRESPRKIKNLNDGVISDYFALRVPEVYLNAAEAAVMLGKETTAIRLMQELRSKRFKSDNNPKIALTGHELLNFVRDERRRELAFEGHRWFDLRRYAVSSHWALQKEIRHVYYDGRLTGNVILKKYDEDAPYYVLLIPENEILINEGSLVQNKDRNRKEPIF